MISKTLMIVYIGVLLLLLLVSLSSSAPTMADPPRPDLSNNNEIKFIITETFHNESVTKDLSCGETTAYGSHPHPREACDDVLSILNGTNTTPPPTSCICTEQYDPVEITLTVTFPGQQEDPYTTTSEFANACIFHCKTSPVPHFVDIGLVPPSSVDESE